MKKYVYVSITLMLIFGAIIAIITKSYDAMNMAWLAIIAHIQLTILDTIKEKKSK